jgi:hypothetical protein
MLQMALVLLCFLLKFSFIIYLFIYRFGCGGKLLWDIIGFGQNLRSKRTNLERVYLQFGLSKKASLFAHHLLVDTSAKRKKKKEAQNHFEPCSSRSKKKEKRKKKEEGRRRNSAGSRRISPALASPDLAGSRRRPTVCFFVFVCFLFCFVLFFSFVFVFFFFRPWVSQPHLAVAVPRFFLVLG